MKIPNPLEANDWDIVSFFQLIAALQLAAWLVIGLDAARLHIPILREVILLVYLLFVPGIILLRVLRLHRLNVVEGLLYTVGLSIATVMLTGLFMNTVYPRFVTARPLTLLPFMLTMSAVVVAFCALCYRRDRDFAHPSAIDMRGLCAPPALAVLLLPFLSIFATYWFNLSGSSVGIIITLLAVAAVILVCGFTNYVPRRYYGIVILAIAVALLFHNALITNYLWGFDIQIEHDVAQFVQTNGFWGAPPRLDPDSMNLNSMLSIAIFAPLLSTASGLSLTWVFKLVFPLLFALVPLGLYRLFEKQTSAQIALFGVFYFMVTFSFSTELLGMARQEIGEFFLVPLLLLLVDKEMSRTPRYTLFGLFGFSLIVSHYSLTYFFLFCLLITWIIVSFTQRYDIAALTRKVTRRKDPHGSVRPFRRPARLRDKSDGASAILVLCLGLITLLWYRFANNAEPFNSLVRMLNRTLAFMGLRVPFLQPGTDNCSSILQIPRTAGRGLDVTGLQTLGVQQLPMHEVTKYLILIALLVSVLGIFVAYVQRQRFRLANEFVAFAIASVLVLFLGLVAPYFAAILNISRFYHITQIVLSVFFVIGFVGIVSVLTTRRHATVTRGAVPLQIKAVACFTVLLFVFNVGLSYKAAGELTDSPTVMALDSSVDFSKYNDREIQAANWLGGTSSGSNVYADYFRFFAVYAIDRDHAQHLPIGGTWASLPQGSYVYLGTPNVQSGQLAIDFDDVTSIPTKIDATYFTGGASSIYSNGDAQIYMIT
jgi:uncharacterized membrane protein